MCKMITISLAQRADIDSCCLYTNREVANSVFWVFLCVSLHNNYQIEDVLNYVVDEKIDINDRTYISKFLSHIIKISCLSIDWYYSQHHTLPILSRHFFFFF